MDDFTAVIDLWNQTLRRLLLFPLPTIAAINGHAFAGGAMMAFCHDYRIMQTEKGWFSVNEVHLQLAIPKWLIKLITFKAPGSKVQTEVILFGKRLVAKDALDLGVVHRTTTSEALLKDAMTMVKDSYKGTPGLQREMLKTMKEDTYAELLQLLDNPEQPLSKFSSKL
jgi:enoyl-CoA hydratase/carnithine racemase